MQKYLLLRGFLGSSSVGSPQGEQVGGTGHPPKPQAGAAPGQALGLRVSGCEGQPELITCRSSLPSAQHGAVWVPAGVCLSPSKPHPHSHPPGGKGNSAGRAPCAATACEGLSSGVGACEWLQLQSQRLLRKGKRQLRQFNKCSTRKDSILEALTLHRSHLRSPPSQSSRGLATALAPADTAESSHRQGHPETPWRAAPRSPPTPTAPAQRCSEVTPRAHELGQPLTKAPQTPYKSFSGFEEDPQEHAAGAGRERSLSRPHQHQWEAFESDPSTRSPFNGALQGR